MKLFFTPKNTKADNCFSVEIQLLFSRRDYIIWRRWILPCHCNNCSASASGPFEICKLKSVIGWWVFVKRSYSRRRYKRAEKISTMETDEVIKLVDNIYKVSFYIQSVNNIFLNAKLKTMKIWIHPIFNWRA